MNLLARILSPKQLRKAIYRSIGALLALGIIWVLIGGFGTMSTGHLILLVILLIVVVI